MDCSPSGFSVQGILQARILEWVAVSSSRGIFLTQGSNPHLLVGRPILYHWATWEAPNNSTKYYSNQNPKSRRRLMVNQTLGSTPLVERIEFRSSLNWINVNLDKLQETEGQGSLACCSPWSRKKSQTRLSNSITITAELDWNPALPLIGL